MDREFIRTCSALQASVLASIAGKTIRIGAFRIRIATPTGHYPIEPDGMYRYGARITLDETESSGCDVVDWQAVEVVNELFGIYLGAAECEAASQ